MDVLDKFLNSISYKFPKGYPDIKNEQDILLLEKELNNLNIKLNLKEANLAGRTTNFSQPTGAFYKYVEQNPKSSEIDYETEKEAILFDKETLKQVKKIPKGEKFKILDKKESDLSKKGPSYVTNISYEGEEFLIRLSDILKPSGKQVDFVKVNLADKTKEGVFVPFKAGHGQEEQIVQLFVNTSNPDYSFNHNGKEYTIERVGAPAYKGKGNPKTDVFVKLNKGISPFGEDLKISLKAANATFVENWMLPTRFEQIIGKEEGKKIVLEFINKIQKGEIGVRSDYMYWFIKSKPYNSIELTKEQEYEAYSGADKFGKDSEATANCYFKGEVPDTIDELINYLRPIEELDADIGLHIRGYAKGGNAACFMKEDGIWTINKTWIDLLGIEETIDKNGNIKYT